MPLNVTDMIKDENKLFNIWGDTYIVRESSAVKRFIYIYIYNAKCLHCLPRTCVRTIGVSVSGTVLLVLIVPVLYVGSYYKDLPQCNVNCCNTMLNVVRSQWSCRWPVADSDDRQLDLSFCLSTQTVINILC